MRSLTTGIPRLVHDFVVSEVHPMNPRVRLTHLFRAALISMLASHSGTASADGDGWITQEIRAPRVRCHTFLSAAAKAEVSFHIYTPEVYDTEKDKRFPVLYWLHGTGGGAQGMAPLSAYFDRAILHGKIAPMLVVFPNGMATSMWCDAKNGSVPVETVVVKELVPHVDAMFRTIARREGRVIEGFSMGGYGAARNGLKYPEIFATVSILAGGPLDLDFAGPRATANPAEHDRILKEVYGGDMDCFKSQSPWMLAQQNAVQRHRASDDGDRRGTTGDAAEATGGTQGGLSAVLLPDHNEAAATPASRAGH